MLDETWNDSKLNKLSTKSFLLKISIIIQIRISPFSFLSQGYFFLDQQNPIKRFFQVWSLVAVFTDLQTSIMQKNTVRGLVKGGWQTKCYRTQRTFISRQRVGRRSITFCNASRFDIISWKICYMSSFREIIIDLCSFVW